MNQNKHNQFSANTNTSSEVHQENMNPAFLMSRVHHLEEQLNHLATVISQDGHIQQVQIGLQSQNEELKALLSSYHLLQEKVLQLQTSNGLLKDSLLKQNEQMQELYNELQGARISNSRMIEKTNTQHLQEKIYQLNDEISNLLMKIQNLMEEINEQQNERQDLRDQLEEFIMKLQQANKTIEELSISNLYLKEEIQKVEELSMKNQKQLQDKYIQDINSLTEELQTYRNSSNKRENSQQIKRNTHDQNLQKEISILRTQVANKNEQMIDLRDIEMAGKKKWQSLIQKKEQEIDRLNEQVFKVKNKLRAAESNCSDYVFQLQQQQIDRQRSIFYKNNYKANQDLRHQITQLQIQKQQLKIKISNLQEHISSRSQHYQLEYHQQSNHKHEEINNYKLNHQQLTQELQLNKQLVKNLKNTICKYEEDYKQLRFDYQQLYQEKNTVQQIVNKNQSELHKNKATYQELIAKYDRTAALYGDLEQQLRSLERDKSMNAGLGNKRLSYDKEDNNLIKLQNSTLKQQLSQMKRQQETNRVFSNRSNTQEYMDYNYETRHHETQKHHSREKQITRELELYRKKYLAQLQKGKREEEYMIKIEELQEKLNRVNKMLNEKIREVDIAHEREEHLKRELQSSYTKHRQQFDNFGVKHHPQVKKLQGQLLASQRTILQMQFHFKQKYNALDDEVKQQRLQNQHHRGKIDELILQLNRERNNIDYNKMQRTLELAELRIKQFSQELDYKENIITTLRSNMQEHHQKGIHHSNHNNNLMQKEHEEMMNKMQILQGYLNSIDTTSKGKEIFQRVISLIENYRRLNNKPLKYYSPTDISMSNIGTSTITQDNEKDTGSRYEQLLREKNQIRQQFDRWQGKVNWQQRSQWERLTRDGHEVKEQRKNILKKYQQEIAS